MLLQAAASGASSSFSMAGNCLCHAQHVTSPLSWLDHDMFLVQLDEFQDVAHAQYRLLYALTCNASSGRLCQRVTIVGDGDQAIYDWRGADVRLFEVWLSLSA